MLHAQLQIMCTPVAAYTGLPSYVQCSVNSCVNTNSVIMHLIPTLYEQVKSLQQPNLTAPTQYLY